MEPKDANFKCIHCGNVYSSLRCISPHVIQAHNKKFRHSDYILTTEEALPLVYGKSRSKAALAKEAEINRLTPNYECVHCGEVRSSLASIVGHVRLTHQKQFESTDYKRTAKEALPSRTKLNKKLEETDEQKGTVECQNLNTNAL